MQLLNQMLPQQILPLTVPARCPHHRMHMDAARQVGAVQRHRPLVVVLDQGQLGLSVSGDAEKRLAS